MRKKNEPGYREKFNSKVRECSNSNLKQNNHCRTFIVVHIQFISLLIFRVFKVRMRKAGEIEAKLFDLSQIMLTFICHLI